MKKIKIILSSLILSVSLSISNANAGLFGFAKEHPILSGLGVAFYAQTTIHKARDLSDHLSKVDTYFQDNPQEFNPISEYVFSALSHPNDKADYVRYKKLAEVMGLENIPPYIATASDPNIVLPNLRQEQNSSDHRYKNPMVQNDVGENIIVTPQGEPFNTRTEFPIEQPKNWDEYLLLKSNSQELAANMKQAGMGVKPPQYAAHHFVPATDEAAQPARDILNKYGIEINNEQNGVYLPTHKETKATQGITHNGRHPESYARKVNTFIRNADNLGGKKSVLNALNDIKNKLQNAPRNSIWSNVL